MTSFLFLLGKQLIALYLRWTSWGSAYGAGSLLVVLVWVYYSVQVFFFGAEFTKVYAETFGSPRSTAARQKQPSGDERPPSGGEP